MAITATTSPRLFLDDPMVKAELAHVQRRMAQSPVSDVFDAYGHQYVDLVMEGGGVLGIALAGYCHALECGGIRFRSVAGTSAGAITALFLHVLAPPGHKRSRGMIREIANMPLADFQDGGQDAWDLVAALREDAGTLTVAARLLPNLSELRRKLGVNPGRKFHRWAAERLTAQGITTLADLRRHLDEAPRGIHYRDPTLGKRQQFVWQAETALITGELGTARKVVLPRDAALFYDDVQAAPVADFLRASMSVPYFFEPFRKHPLPRHRDARKAWKRFKPRGAIPTEAVFVDGGLLSNFPISEFHRVDRSKPTMPTFGVKLGVDEGAVRDVSSLRGFTGALVDAMRFNADREFLYDNPDYRQLIAEIHTHGFHWLDFAMSDGEKLNLFRAGVTAARRFLEGFDWRAYHASR